MPLFKSRTRTPFVPPSSISREEFIRKYWRALLIHGAVTSISAFGFYLILQTGKISWVFISFIIILGIPYLLETRVKLSEIFIRRLMGAFPRFNVTRMHVFCYLPFGCPLLFIGFSIYLHFKKGTHPDQLPFFLRNWGKCFLTVLGLNLGLIVCCYGEYLSFSTPSPRSPVNLSALSYWTAGPITHFIVDLNQKTNILINIQKAKSTEKKVELADYLEFLNTKNYSATETLVITGTLLASVKKEQLSQSSEEKDKTHFKKIADIVALMESWDKQLPYFSNFNPVFISIPFALLEIILINSVTVSVDYRAQEIFFRRLSEAIENLNTLPSLNQIEIERLKTRFMATKAYRFHFQNEGLK